MRASHRALFTPPANYLGLPYHHSYETDQLPLTVDAPTELVLDLLPIARDEAEALAAIDG